MTSATRVPPPAPRHMFDFDLPDSFGQRVHFRMLESLLWAYAIYWSWTWAADLKRIDSIVFPVGLGRYVDLSFLAGTGHASWLAGVISVFGLLAFFRFRERLFYPAAVVCLHILFVTRHGLGKITHSSNFVGVSLLVFAVAMWFSADHRVRRRFAWDSTCAMVGLGYVSAGFSKLTATGPTWVDGRHLFLWISERQIDGLSASGVLRSSAVQELVQSSVLLATIFLSIGLLVELAGFLFFFPRARPIIAVGCIGLHFGTSATLNIFFAAFVAQLLVLCFPWDRAIDFARARWVASAGARSAPNGPY